MEIIVSVFVLITIVVRVGLKIKARKNQIKWKPQSANDIALSMIKL